VSLNGSVSRQRECNFHGLAVTSLSQAMQEVLYCLKFEDVTNRVPETSANNFPSELRKIPEQRKSQTVR
jgi:hypothetical protein